MILKKEYSDIVRYWLYLLLFLLIVIIVVGGLTRLTNSGLSITEWKVISGIFPPFNNEDWYEAFDLYKKIPQYYLVNTNISLAEFKTIYYWEYFYCVHKFFRLIIYPDNILPLNLISPNYSVLFSFEQLNLIPHNLTVPYHPLYLHKVQ